MLEGMLRPTAHLPVYTQMNEVLLHIDYVDGHYQYQEKAVSAIDAYRYQGNLYGLFYEMGIDPALHMYTMQLNGYKSPINYEGRKLIFKVPVMPPIPN